MSDPTPAGIDPGAAPSGTGCVECDEAGGWWVHLRRCAQCYEPGEDWFWDVARSAGIVGPRLADPQHHPEDQPVPGPAGRVPDDWRDHVH